MICKLKLVLQVFLSVLFIFSIFFLSSQKVQATDTEPNPEPGLGFEVETGADVDVAADIDVFKDNEPIVYENIVINEVMVDPASHNGLCDYDSCEWVELYNAGTEPVNLKSWKVDNKEITVDLWIKDYLIFTKNASSFSAIWNSVPSEKVFQLSISLANNPDTLTIKNATGDYEESFSWDESPGEDISWERIDLDISADDPNNWQKSYVLGGTPGMPNSQPTLPDYPDEVLDLINIENALIYTVQVSSVTDGDTIKVSGLPTNFSSTIRFLAVDAAEAGQTLFKPAKDFTGQLLGQTIDLIISQEADEQIDNSYYNRTLAVVIFQDRVFNTQLLERGLASFYDTDNLVLKNAAWQEIEAQAQQELIGLWASTATSVILSELLPNPVGLDNEGEWIELYNPLSRKVNLSYFLLGSYLIPYGIIILPKSFMIFPRPQTGIALNNSGGTLKLFFPDGLLADEVSYGKAKEGFSWAFADGTWQWTETITPLAANIIYIYQEEEDTSDEDETKDENIPINSTPVEVKTGEIENYENYLVKIQGEVVSTSGNTFYLNDGSGKAKVYIQERTGIDKPPMRTGDIFEIIGIVNLYRGAWRVLPQKQDDIKLLKSIQEAKAAASASTKKSQTTSKKTTTKAATNPNVSARAPTKKIAGNTADIANDLIETKSVKTSFLVQSIKAVTGFAIILLVLLIVKVLRFKKETPLGGNFGDYT